MATIYCSVTGWPQRRRFIRGYRMKDDRCTRCHAKLVRKPPAGTPAQEYEPAKGECRSHDCWGHQVQGIDLGISRPRHYEGAHYYPPPAYHQYAVYRRYRCPECGTIWEERERSWTEPIGEPKVQESKGGLPNSLPDRHLTG